MPELLEVEYYRRALHERVGARVERIKLIDSSYSRPKGSPVEPFEQFVGTTLSSTRRHGKLLLADFARPDGDIITLGMRFGMTGRLLFDGVGPIERLEYSSAGNKTAWDRFGLLLDATWMTIRDPRRLGSVELDPSVDGLGPDAWAISAKSLAAALGRRRKAVKAALLDQSIIAGLGNLLTDEILWQAEIDPRRPANDLTNDELDQLAESIREVVDELDGRGGSHMGDSFDARQPGVLCPRCNTDCAAMQHITIGGRSTWWCPSHQQ